MRPEDFEAICHRGTLAWRQLKKDKNWSHWVQVGEALIAGREWAMNQAGTNQPKGKGYNLVFGEWLDRYKLADIDKGDRSRLLTCMDNLPAIEDWRRTLPLSERLKLNHPNAVLRRWQAFIKPEPRTATGEPKPTLRDSVVNLSEELERANAHIAELEAARDAVFRTMQEGDDEQIASWLAAWMPDLNADRWQRITARALVLARKEAGGSSAGVTALDPRPASRRKRSV